MAAPFRTCRRSALSPKLFLFLRAFYHCEAACSNTPHDKSQKLLVFESGSIAAEHRLGAIQGESANARWRRAGGRNDSWRFGAGLASALLVALLGASNAVAESNETHEGNNVSFNQTLPLHVNPNQPEKRSLHRSNAEECRHRLRLSLLACQASPAGEARESGASKASIPKESYVCESRLLGHLPQLQAHTIHSQQLPIPACCEEGIWPAKTETYPVHFNRSPPAVKLVNVNSSTHTPSAIPESHPPHAPNPETSSNQTPHTSSPNSPPWGPPWGDEVAHARQGLAKRLTNLDSVDTKAIPWPIIAKKGQQVSVRFKLAPSADFSHFVVDAIARLGADPQEGSPSSGPLVRVQAYDSLVARHILILPSLQNPSLSVPESTTPHTKAASAPPSIKPLESTPPETQNPSSVNAPLDTARSSNGTQAPGSSSSVSIVVFQSLVGEPTTEVEYIRRGRFTEPELDAIASGIKIGIGRPETKGSGFIGRLETKESDATERRDATLGDGLPKALRESIKGYQSSPEHRQDQTDGSRGVRGYAKGLKGSGGLAKESESADARERRKTRGRIAAALSKLESMGVRVYGAEKLTEETGENEPVNHVGEATSGTWGHLAGYEEQKQEIEDSILLALQRPDVYDRIARGTRREYETNRPRAILFDGPPGTGKTSCARVIAGRAGVPLLYVPLEAVASKYYGESERLLAAVFNAGKDFPNGCLVFLDEIDALATERDASTHEATRRILSVLLRQLDGFEPDRRTIIIAATNRKEDLDAALLSRFDTALTFGLPDARTRGEIVAQYARHLSSSERDGVAAATDGMSGRDIRDICEQAERHWASKVIRTQVPQELPTVDEYLRCCTARRQGLAKPEQRTGRAQNRQADTQSRQLDQQFV